jgi:hypothetical protein
MRRPTEYLGHLPVPLRGGLAAISAAFVLMAALAGVSGLGWPFAGLGRPSGPVPALPPGLYLMLTQSDVSLLRTAAPALAAKLLSRPATIVLARSASGPATGRALRVALFTSYAQFRRELSRHQIPAGVAAVAYDPERWWMTPAREQDHPVRYLGLFGQAARRSGYPAILMPGRDVLLAPGAQCRKRPGEPLDAAFLRCQLAGQSARLSRIFGMQTAPVELDVADLRSFAAGCARQARAANSRVILIATLSTMPDHSPATDGQLVRAAAAIRPFVQGFELNMTRASAGTGIAFLRGLAG